MFGESSRTLGKYHLIAEIARGGMGIVYLALVQGPGGFNKLVVVKELKQELSEDPSFLTMFLDEARLAARLNHPNIVQTNEVGNDGDRHFMAMDYLEGRTYERVRRRSKNTGKTAGERLTLPMQLRIFCDVLEGLEYAHKLADFDGTALQVVHRDVSPNNVFITFDGHVKLLDFGIAKAADHNHETQAGMLKGKLSYMAPEQAKGKKVDARADVFSVGIMLWEAVAGHRLRQAGDDLTKAFGDVPIPRLLADHPGVDPLLDEIVAKATAIDPDERYQSAAQLQTALERYLSSIFASPAPREIGAVVNELFKDERAKTSSLIEGFVTRARQGGGGTSQELPVIEMASPALNTPLPTKESFGKESETGTGSGFSGSISVSAESKDKNVDTVGGSLPSTAPVMPAAPRGRGKALIAGGVIALGVVGLVAYKLGASDSPKPAPVVTAPAAAAPEPPPTTAPAAAAPPASTTVAPSVATIGVDVRATPADAAITIDDALVSSNPFRGRYRQDGVMHHIRITAEGFEPQTRDVAFDHDVAIDIELRKPAGIASRAKTRQSGARIPAKPAQHVTTPIETPPPLPPPTATTSTTTPAKPDINPQGGQKPTRTIDTKNPYGTP